MLKIDINLNMYNLLKLGIFTLSNRDGYSYTLKQKTNNLT